MSSQPFTAAALRGAVDLSSLKRPPAGAPTSSSTASSTTGSGAAGAGAGRPGGGVVVEGTDASFSGVVNGSMTVPAVVVLWSSRLPESGDFADLLARVAGSYAGRFRLVTVDVDTNPGLMRAFQVQSVPVTMGLLQGQPVPLFSGIQPEATIRAYVDELLALAVTNGVAGRVPGVEDAAPEVPSSLEPELSPLHGAAYDAIERGDLEAARKAYELALQQDPGDVDARLGLAQVDLMRRTVGADPDAARAAADADPSDVAAQILAADLDVLEGAVEQAFARLVDTVRTTSGDERNQARQHLLELFEVVGADDERVVAGRRALMSALF